MEAHEISGGRSRFFHRMTLLLLLSLLLCGEAGRSSRNGCRRWTGLALLRLLPLRRSPRLGSASDRTIGDDAALLTLRDRFPHPPAQTCTRPTAAAKFIFDLSQIQQLEANNRSPDSVRIIVHAVARATAAGDGIHRLAHVLHRAFSRLSHFLRHNISFRGRLLGDQHALQFRRRRLLHWQTGIFILHVPPRVCRSPSRPAASSATTATRSTGGGVRRIWLLVDADAPMVSVGAVGVDQLESSAGLFDGGEGDAVFARHVIGVVGGHIVSVAAADVMGTTAAWREFVGYLVED
mmetsp:Transcript_16309/g.39018  ORF Transcript_16309/g.39018 Transcript_16309/m.39018 type:complete len:293 (-) Transcript_16309:78-956(-)